MPPKLSLAWLSSFLICVSALALGEAVVAEVRLGFFSSGYGGAYVDSSLGVLVYFAASAVCDAFFVLGVWALILPICARLAVGSTASLALATFVSCTIPAATNLASGIAVGLLGRAISLLTLFELAGRDTGEMLIQAATQTPAFFWALPGLAGVIALLCLSGRRLEQRWPKLGDTLAPPPAGTLFLLAVACGVLGTIALASDAPWLERVRLAVARKTSATALATLASRVTDVDWDGYGVLSLPADPAPFDASVAPYALDVPGNGRDENGLAGDHPVGYPAPSSVPVAEAPPARAPRAVVLIFLETFRGDLIGMEYGGRPVTPVLNALAAEGSMSRRAFAHTPYTYQSRLQLIQGTVATAPGRSTILDDFAARGFEVAYFSGQNETFGETDALLRLDTADVFYDARTERDRNVGEGAGRAGMMVSWKQVGLRVDEFLAARASGSPLFLYVNFVDTHFPFHHEELDNVLGIEPIARRDIRPARRRQVFENYLNAVANVDRAIGRLIASLESQFPRDELAIVVTADHGAEIYEDGNLGYGHRLDRYGTHVPLITRGIGGEWPEPIGNADLRGLLSRSSSAGEAGQVRFVADPTRRLFQFLGALETPSQIGLRSSTDVATYHFKRDVFELRSFDDAPIEATESIRAERFRELALGWEALVWQEHAASAGAP